MGLVYLTSCPLSLYFRPQRTSPSCRQCSDMYVTVFMRTEYLFSFLHFCMSSELSRRSWLCLMALAAVAKAPWSAVGDFPCQPPRTIPSHASSCSCHISVLLRDLLGLAVSFHASYFPFWLFSSRFYFALLVMQYPHLGTSSLASFPSPLVPMFP